MPQLIIYAAPFFFFFIALEWILILREQRKYPIKNTLASIGVGMGTLVVDFIMKSFLVAGVFYLCSLSPFSFGRQWYMWVLCVVVLDFCTYIGHRLGHGLRFFWASHVPHHSPQVYNLSVGIRLSWLQHVKVFVFAPVPLLGFDPMMILICYQATVIYQFWIHTELIGRLGWIEWIFVTPMHHRLHHAMNPEYIDKNFGSVLIIWDRLFGTFVTETEKPVYGITRQLDSHNPFTITFHEFADLARDLKKAKSWKQRWNHLFKHPGWQPKTENYVQNTHQRAS